MADTRQKDGQWVLQTDKNGCLDWAMVTVAVLMDIRDELKSLNRVLHCQNFLSVPLKLDRIAKNTRRPKRRKPTVTPKQKSS